MRAYSTDLRKRVVKTIQNGLSHAQTAKRFSVSVRTVYNWHHQQRATGTLTHQVRPGRPRTIPAREQATLLAQLEAHADATLEDHCRLWAESAHAHASVPTMHRALERLRWTRKKDPARQRTQRG